MTKSIYYLPGHGGRLSTGLGDALLSRGFDLAGRETVGDFRTLPFTEQVSIVADDLRSAYGHERARVIANSFGAYLFLNAQITMDPFPGKVLLLSPIVGEFANQSAKMGFIPPHAGNLMKLALSGAYPTPMQCQIHVGAQDWQSDPEVVTEFAKHVGIDVNVVPNAGHMLDKAYVSRILDEWLASDA